MNIKKIFCIWLCVCLLIPLVSVSANKGEQKLDQYRDVHPRILVESEESFTTIKKNIESDERISQLFQVFLNGLEAVIAKGPTTYYLAPTDREDLWMRQIGDDIGNLTFAYKLTGDKKYFQAASILVDTVLTYPTWGRAPAFENNDLAAAHMFVGIAVYYDWIFSELDGKQKEKIVEELRIRGTKMRRGAWYNMELMQNHLWISICGLIFAGAAIYDVYPEAEEWFRYGILKYNQIYTYMPSDGSSHEGMLYWQYGAKYLSLFNQTIEKFTDTQYRDVGFIKNTGDFALYNYMPLDSSVKNMNVFNFGDAVTNYGEDSIETLAYLANVNNNPVTQWITNRCADFMISNKVLTNFDTFTNYNYDLSEQSPNEGNYPTAKLFPDLNYVFLKSDWNGSESSIAFRNGPALGRYAAAHTTEYNLGAGHNHSDANHFVIMANNDWLFKDDGYVTNKTAQHNTLLVDGKGQFGEGPGGWTNAVLQKIPEIIAFESDDLFDYVVGDAAVIYPENLGLNKFNRHFLFLKPDVLIVIDEVETSAQMPLELRFHPNADNIFKMSDGTFFFVVNNTKCLVKPFVSEGAVSQTAMIKRHADKSGTMGEKNTIQVMNTTDRWVQATAFSWSDRSTSPKQVDLSRKGNNLHFTVGSTKVNLDLESRSVQTTKTHHALNVKLNGLLMDFNASPILNEGRLLIPLSNFSESLNLYSDFDRATGEIKLVAGEKTIKLVVNKKEIIVNDQRMQTDTEPIMRDGILYIPLRVVSEALGYGVYFDSIANAANVISEESPKIDLAAIFVADKLATPTKENPNIWKTSILGSDFSVDVIPSVTGSQVILEQDKKDSTRFNIQLISPDGKQNKDYVLICEKPKGLGTVPVEAVTYSTHDGNIGENTIDGLLTTRWSASGLGQWIQYELARETELTGVGLAFNLGRIRRATFEVFVSEDGENFTQVMKTTSSGTTDDMERYPFEKPIKAKYVKIVGYGNSQNIWNSITEVGFF